MSLQTQNQNKPTSPTPAFLSTKLTSPDMKVFITGGSGHIGGEIIPQLIAAGHNVTALSRSSSSTQRLVALGATPVQGSHIDLEILRKEAAAADAVIHCAFNHDTIFKPNGYAEAAEQDRAAISAMCDALVGTGKTFINSSGTLGNIGSDEMAKKAEGPEALKGPNAGGALRGMSEKVVVSYAKSGIRGINIRLAPVVHGKAREHKFIAGQIPVAKQAGFVGYIGDGSNLWQGIHVKDAATLYVLALTAEGVHPGATLNGITENIPQKDIAEFIGRKLNLPTKSVAVENAKEHWGLLGDTLTAGGLITNELTKERTGWEPTGPTLFETLEWYQF